MTTPKDIRRFAEFEFNGTSVTGNVESVALSPIGLSVIRVPGKYANFPIPGRWSDMEATWNIFTYDASILGKNCLLYTSPSPRDS